MASRRPYRVLGVVNRGDSGAREWADKSAWGSATAIGSGNGDFRSLES